MVIIIGSLVLRIIREAFDESRTEKLQLTVILPVRNGREYIRAAVGSVLMQSFSNFELWVLENGSDDDTADIVRSIVDPRLRLFELGPVGIQGALQYAIENAPTPWLARMDADDLMFPGRLEAQMEFLKDNPDVVFLGTAYAFLTPFGHILELPTRGSRQVTKEELAGRRGFPDSSLVFNRLAAQEAGGVDQEFVKCDGLSLMFRLLSQGKAWALGDHLQLYRLRPDSLSKEHEHDEESRRIHHKYAPEFFRPYSEQPQRRSFWGMVAKLELLSGDIDAMKAAIQRTANEQNCVADVSGFPFNGAFGALGRAYYKWRYSGGVRHRSDWERLFAPLLHEAQQN